MISSKDVLIAGLCAVVVLSSSVFGSFINVYKRHSELNNHDPECGEPLYLTPLIESKDIERAKKLSFVTHPEFHVDSYSGYLTVDKRYQSHTFFWYFPALSSPDVPVVIWLQGGPGATSLFGLFTENGPFQIKDNHVVPRPYSWNTNYHLIYFDNPVGTGFSQTAGGYAQNETIIGEHLHEALRQFYEVFPELKAQELYVTGESYAGKYVPAFCHTIHHKNLGTKDPINLKGFAIGNGLSDPVNQMAYSKYLYQIGLLDLDGSMRFSTQEALAIKYIKQKKWRAAQIVLDNLLDGDLTPSTSLFYNLTGFKNYFHYLVPKEDEHTNDFQKVVNKASYRKALHVGNLTFHTDNTVEIYMLEDIVKSVAHWVLELLYHYRAVIYNGQLDIVVAYPLTENFLSKLNYPGWSSAKRKFWRVHNELAGYSKTCGNLTALLVRNSGHMVPTDQPVWMLDILDRLTSNKPF